MSEIEEVPAMNGNGPQTAVLGDGDASQGADEATTDEGYATLQKPVPNGACSGPIDEETKSSATGGRRKVSLTSSTMDTDDRRSDEPTKLSFEKGT